MENTNTGHPEIEVLIWLDDDVWDDTKQQEIMDAFGPLKAKKDINAAVGAGAEGILPELHVLIILGVGSIVDGFLQAIGEDIWELIKSGIRKAITTKPTNMPNTLNTEFINEPDHELVWWIYSEDIRVLVNLNRGTGTFSQALASLPSYIDELLNQGMDSYIVYWDENEWKHL